MAHCPACQTPHAAQPLHRFEADEAAQSFVLAEEYPQQHRELARHIRSLWGGDHCQVRVCSGCGLHFAWPFKAGDARFYNLAYPYSAYPTERWEFDETAKSLASAPPTDGLVLEIGSGFGHFLRKVSPSLLPRERVLAVEYNDTARARLRAEGYNAIGEDIRSPTFDAWRGQLAAVFMFQVLEHMDELDAVVSRLNQLLRPGASLYVAVPNLHRIVWSESHASLYDMPPNHISTWSEGALRALAERAGWTLEAHRTEPMSWRGLLKEDLVYSHMRRAQRSGSLANRLRALPRTRLRVAAEGALALLAAPSRASAWAAAWRSDVPLGGSVWVRMRAAGAG